MGWLMGLLGGAAGKAGAAGAASSGGSGGGLFGTIFSMFGGGSEGKHADFEMSALDEFMSGMEQTSQSSMSKARQAGSGSPAFMQPTSLGSLNISGGEGIAEVDDFVTDVKTSATQGLKKVAKKLAEGKPLSYDDFIGEE